MRRVILALWLSVLTLAAQDFTNRVVTFTNLEGRIFRNVALVRADLDGLVWRSGASGGRVCYTNIAPDVLLPLGIPTNRIAVARARAELKSVADARRYAADVAAANAKAAADERERAEWLAGAPARDREAQRQADLAKIKALSDKISAAEYDLRHQEAAVSDYNRANLYNDYAPYLFVKDSVRVTLDDARAQLDRMRADYAAKYGHLP